MKSFRLLLAVTALAMAFLFTVAVSTAIAGSLGNGAAQRMKLVIDSVDASSGTVVFKSGVDQSMHTYKIDATTKLSLMAKKATIDQIKPGEKVVNYTVRGGLTADGSSLDMLMLWQAAPAAQ